MSKINLKAVNGPVAGENYLADTKNYPWHQPPKVTDYDEGVELVFKRLTSKKRVGKILTAIEMGMPLNILTSTLLTIGISKGDFTPDFAILLAGPTAHILQMLATEFEIDYENGWDEVIPENTAEIYKSMERMKNFKPNQQPEMEPMVDPAQTDESMAPAETVTEQPADMSGGLLGGM